MDQPTHKLCSRCKQSKPLEEFGPHKKTPTGRQPACRACVRARRAEDPERHRAYQAKYRDANREDLRAKSRARDSPERRRAYYEANRDRIREQQRSYRKANAEAKRAIDAAYRAANAEAIRQYQIAYYEQHKAEAIKRSREWAKRNPARIVERGSRRRAQKASTAIGPVDLEALWTGACGICGESMDRSLRRPDPLSPSLDHIFPLSRGGGHVQDNLQWAHLVCNFRKGARIDY